MAKNRQKKSAGTKAVDGDQTEAPRPKARRNQLKKSELKWGTDLWSSGWTGIPTVILHRQKALKLTPLDVNVLLHLVSYWWDHDRLPFPSKNTIAECIGRSARTVGRSLEKMSDQGILERHLRRGQTTKYGFGGLKKQARPFAEEALEEKRRRVRDARRDARTTKPKARPEAAAAA